MRKRTRQTSTSLLEPEVAQLPKREFISTGNSGVSIPQVQPMVVAQSEQGQKGEGIFVDDDAQSLAEEIQSLIKDEKDSKNVKVLERFADIIRSIRGNHITQRGLAEFLTEYSCGLIEFKQSTIVNYEAAKTLASLISFNAIRKYAKKTSGITADQLLDSIFEEKTVEASELVRPNINVVLSLIERLSAENLGIVATLCIDKMRNTVNEYSEYKNIVGDLGLKGSTESQSSPKIQYYAFSGKILNRLSILLKVSLEFQGYGDELNLNDFLKDNYSLPTGSDIFIISICKGISCEVPLQYLDAIAQICYKVRYWVNNQGIPDPMFFYKQEKYEDFKSLFEALSFDEKASLV